MSGLGATPAAAGMRGGEIVAAGTPEVVAKEPRSFTGQYLAPMLVRGK